MNKKIYIKPFYYLLPTINSSGIVYVNDIPVIKNIGKTATSGMLTGQVPINHIVLESGKYKVKGLILPRQENKKLTTYDGMKIEFKVYDNDNWKETRSDFHPEISTPELTMVTNDNPNSSYANKFKSPIENLPSYIIETEIEIELPFNLNGWQNSINLKEYYKDKKEALKKIVLNYYEQINNILIEHSASKFLEISQDKEELQAKAFYYNETQKQETRQEIISLFNENLDVLPLNGNELNLEIFGNGKLVSLSRLDGSSALQFISPNLKESNVELDIKLHMNSKSKQLSII